MRVFILAVSLLVIAPSALAQITVARKVKSKEAAKSYQQFTLAAVTWQENIKATSGANSAGVEMQMQGLAAGYTKNIPFSRSHWRYNYYGEISTGIAKGQGDTAAIADEFKNQVWSMFTFAPGLAVRTTPVTDFGMRAPLALQMIHWSLDQGSGLKLEKAGGAFSAGLGAFSAFRFSEESQMQIAATYQFLWQATIWSIGYNRKF